jgi:glutamine synthetase
MTSTLLAKDTSHRTVFPVFDAGDGLPPQGAGNIIMVADPDDLPRAAMGRRPAGCWRHRARRRAPVTLSTRALYRAALAGSASSASTTAGLESSSICFGSTTCASRRRT